MKNKIFRKIFAVFLMLIVTAGISSAQSLKVRLQSDYFNSIEQMKNNFTSPPYWEKSDWVVATFVLGTTIGLYTYDQKIQEWAQDNRSRMSDEIANLARPFGDLIYTLPPISGLYFYGHYFENEKDRRIALLGVESLIISGIFTSAIKFGGHRHRPSTGDTYDRWDGPGFSDSNLSFPSGHASSAFAIATVIASESGDRTFVSPLAYGIATLTALSRVNDNEHWASDVFFGSAIGYLTAKAIINYNAGKNKNFAILPLTNGKDIALIIYTNFN